MIFPNFYLFFILFSLFTSFFSHQILIIQVNIYLFFLLFYLYLFLILIGDIFYKFNFLKVKLK